MKMRNAFLKLASPLFVLWDLFASFVMKIWASRRKPHPLAMEKFGIQIVAPKDYGSMDDHADAYNALIILKRFEPEKLEQIQKWIRIIFFHSLDGAPGYLRFGRICYLSPPKNCPAGTAPIVIAGLLIYFAALAEVKKGFFASEEVKSFCRNENKRVVEKLSEALCE
jgi:hypothetical protein